MEEKGAGWLIFASIVLGVAGIMRIFDAIWAFSYHGAVPSNLETALFGVPEIVCYKGSAVSYQIARRLIKVKFISLVNLIMDKPVVKELIQDELTPDNLRRELEDLLHNDVRRQQLSEDYRDLHGLLSQGGHASANAAASILRFMRAAQPVSF